jgi:hypothetical protein
MRVGQVTCLIFLLFSNSSVAQVTNGDAKNWLVRTTTFTFDENDQYDIQNGDNYPTFLLKAAIDDNGVAGVLMNHAFGANNGEDFCIYEDAEIPHTWDDANVLIEAINETETDFDIANYDHWLAIYGANQRCSPQNVFVGFTSIRYRNVQNLIDAVYQKPNEWNERKIEIAHNSSSVGYETIWRYNKGNTINEPLEMGEIGHLSKKTHINSNRGALGNFAYTNEYGESSPDVYYTFTIPNGRAQKVTH